MTHSLKRFSGTTKQALLHQIAVLVVVGIGLATMGWLSPSQEVALLFIAVWATMNPKVRAFLVDFAPLVLLVLTYDTLRGYADEFTTSQIHVRELIDAEQSVFGTVPAYYLQQHLWNQPYTPILDAITNFFYLSHFMSPVLLSVLLWRYDRSKYWAFAWGLVALSYAAFATYLIFPAAPPWWATRYGYLLDQPVSLSHFAISAEQVAHAANPVAAMPSLHTAYPTYFALVAISVWGRKALPVIGLPIAVAFSTYYLGHHWVIDSMVGVAYASVSFGTVFLYLKHRHITMEWLGQLTRTTPNTAHTQQTHRGHGA